MTEIDTDLLPTLGAVMADCLEEAAATARLLDPADPWPAIVTLTSVSRELGSFAAVIATVTRRAEIERDRAARP